MGLEISFVPGIPGSRYSKRWICSDRCYCLSHVGVFFCIWILFQPYAHCVWNKAGTVMIESGAPAAFLHPHA